MASYLTTDFSPAILLPLTFINLLAYLLYYINRTFIRGYKGLKKLIVSGRGLIIVGFIKSIKRVRDSIFISI
jgi:hypothetical protein